MNREEKLALLSGLSEEDFTKKFPIPLFQTMGYTLVDYSHGPLEIGKDLILLDEDRMHHRRYIAIQVKKGNIDTQKSKDIAFDICTAFGSTFKDLSDNTEKHFSEFIVINSGEINKFARQQIFAFMQRDDLKRVVRFMDDPELITLIYEYRMDLLWDEYDYFKHYFEVLADKFRKIEDAFTLGMKESPELEKLWVPVNLSETVTEEMTLPDVEEERVLAPRRERQIRRKMKIEEALRTHRKFVITGRPGSGKSTTLTLLQILLVLS
jgi:hypothetical protein